MQQCQWPGCPREQNGPYCFPHGRGNTVKEKIKAQQPLTLPELTERAQKEFNRYIRDRDRVKGCITCGGQVTDAGHYIPVGENSALRYEEDNVHGQCNFCNTVKAGNRAIYRAVLIQKITLERVIELETYPKFNKWTRPQLEGIISHYSLEKTTNPA